MRPLVYPVLHYLHDSQAMANADLAVEAGVDGLFLISMEGQDDRLEASALAIKAKYPALKVGINYLQSSAAQAIHRNIEVGLHMTWADDAGVHSVNPNLETQKRIQEALALNPSHQFFGGASFKYLAPEPNPGEAARMAAAMGITPTTSGPGTGRAAPLSKIAAMSAALGGTDLAIASGVTPDNVLDYAPYLSHILVSSGVSRDFHNFDFELLCQLMGKLKTAEAATTGTAT